MGLTDKDKRRIDRAVRRQCDIDDHINPPKSFIIKSKKVYTRKKKHKDN